MITIIIPQNLKKDKNNKAIKINSENKDSQKKELKIIKIKIYTSITNNIQENSKK